MATTGPIFPVESTTPTDEATIATPKNVEGNTMAPASAVTAAACPRAMGFTYPTSPARRITTASNPSPIQNAPRTNDLRLMIRPATKHGTHTDAKSTKRDCDRVDSGKDDTAATAAKAPTAANSIEAPSARAERQARRPDERARRTAS